MKNQFIKHLAGLGAGFMVFFSTAQNVSANDSSLAVDPSTVFGDRPLWGKFADKDLVAGQGIDSIATGTGAADPTDLESLDSFGVNTEFRGFRPIMNTLSNHLVFNRNKTAFRFEFDLDMQTADEWTGVATHTDWLNVSGPAGPEVREGVYLGILNEGWKSFSISVGLIDEDLFHRTTDEGFPYGIRAAGFVAVNILNGADIEADFYGTDGRLLTTLTGTGTNGAPMTSGGDEIFFGYDAGEDPSDWISKIVIRGQMAGQAGFDDFGFTPIYAINDDGEAVEISTGEEGKWAGFDLINGYAYTGERLGWVYPSGDWIFMVNLNRWSYLPEFLVTPSGVWMYLFM